MFLAVFEPLLYQCFKKQTKRDIGLVIDEIVRGVIMFIRWKSGKWEKKIIVKDNNAEYGYSQAN